MSRELAAFRAGIRRSVWAEREGLLRLRLLHPSPTLRDRRRPGAPASWPPLSRRLVEPKGSNPALFRANENKKGPEVPFYIFILAEREGFEPSKGF